MRVANVERLRQAIAAVRRRRNQRRRRYSSDLRRSIVAYVVKEGQRGVSRKAAAKTLGLSYTTLCSWMPRGEERFRSVTVSAGVQDAADVLELVTAQGHRVVGLNREDAAYLLRALG